MSGWNKRRHPSPYSDCCVPGGLRWALRAWTNIEGRLFTAIGARPFLLTWPEKRFVQIDITYNYTGITRSLSWHNRIIFMRGAPIFPPAAAGPGDSQTPGEGLGNRPGGGSPPSPFEPGGGSFGGGGSSGGWDPLPVPPPAPPPAADTPPETLPKDSGGFGPSLWSPFGLGIPLGQPLTQYVSGEYSGTAGSGFRDQDGHWSGAGAPNETDPIFIESGNFNSQSTVTEETVVTTTYSAVGQQGIHVTTLSREEKPDESAHLVAKYLNDLPDEQASDFTVGFDQSGLPVAFIIKPERYEDGSGHTIENPNEQTHLVRNGEGRILRSKYKLFSKNIDWKVGDGPIRITWAERFTPYDRSIHPTYKWLEELLSPVPVVQDDINHIYTANIETNVYEAKPAVSGGDASEVIEGVTELVGERFKPIQLLQYSSGIFELYKHGFREFITDPGTSIARWYKKLTISGSYAGCGLTGDDPRDYAAYLELINDPSKSEDEDGAIGPGFDPGNWFQGSHFGGFIEGFLIFGGPPSRSGGGSDNTVPLFPQDGRPGGTYSLAPRFFAGNATGTQVNFVENEPPKFITPTQLTWFKEVKCGDATVPDSEIALLSNEYVTSEMTNAVQAAIEAIFSDPESLIGNSSEFVSYRLLSKDESYFGLARGVWGLFIAAANLSYGAQDPDSDEISVAVVKKRRNLDTKAVTEQNISVTLSRTVDGDYASDFFPEPFPSINEEVWIELLD